MVPSTAIGLLLLTVGMASANPGVVIGGGGGGPSHVFFTVYDWPGSGLEINNTYVTDGGSIELQPGVSVPASFTPDEGVTLG